MDEELDRLLDSVVIEPVPKPPTWVNPLVVVPKSNGDIRICVDMQRANFAKIDLNQGYHQLLLHPDSCDLTSFACHKVIFRYTCLIFGMSAAAEIYQHHIEQTLAGLPKNISDDIIVGGQLEKLEEK